MKRNFDNKDFEQFLKKNADQYRMYPSEKVWTEIHNSLHPRRRWAAIAASLLLITGAIVTWTMWINPDTPGTSVLQQQTVPATPIKEKTLSGKSTSPAVQALSSRNPITSNKIPSIILESTLEPENVNLSNEKVVVFVRDPFLFTEAQKEDGLKILDYNAIDILTKSNIPGVVTAENSDRDNLAISPNNVEAWPLETSLLSMSKSQPTPSIQKNTTKKKVTLQLYFTPGVSYRRLTENKEVILAASGTPAIPTNLALQDVKNVVTHKPDIGFELGLAAKYPVSKIVTVKGGIQFNVNKYDIRAFSFSGEPATIAVQGDPFQQQTFIRTSYYRNSSGYKPNWLTNVYFSLSMPVGAEFKIFNTKKLDLGFGITAQPTYLLDNRAYMISTDYKNYVKVPDLIRRWNINAGAELIVGIQTAKTRWQIGPQIRYQTLSSFKDKYPVKENLFNYGLKVGVSLNQ